MGFEMCPGSGIHDVRGAMGNESMSADALLAFDREFATATYGQTCLGILPYHLYRDDFSLLRLLVSTFQRVLADTYTECPMRDPNAPSDCQYRIQSDQRPFSHPHPITYVHQSTSGTEKEIATDISFLTGLLHDGVCYPLQEVIIHSTLFG